MKLKFTKRIISALLAAATVAGVFGCLGFAAFAAAPSSIGTGNYYITNAKTGVRLVLSGNKDADGTVFKAANASSIDVSQVMRITKSGDGYRICPAESTTRSAVAKLSGGKVADGASLALYSYNDAKEQRFYFYRLSNGAYQIKTAANTSLLLTASGKNVNLKADNTKDPASQQWNLENFVLKGAGTDPDGKLPYGVDVSEHQSWQKQINWEAAKNYGVKFAIIRLGYGDNLANQDDRAFSYNVSECRRLGIPFGVYIYSYAENTKQAKSEAAHCLRLVKGLPLSYPIYYDLEDPDTTAKCSNAEILKIAKTFEAEITKAGYSVGFYANTYWWTTKLTDSYYNNFSRWVAQYNTSCTYQGSKDMWQYSSEGKVAGIYGNVDMNVLYGLMPKYTYTGAALTPKFAVTADGATLKEDVDYTVSYQNNVNAGLATFTAVGKGEREGQILLVRNFVIVPQKIGSAQVTASVRFKNKKPVATVKATYGGKTLHQGTDYTVSVKAGKNNEVATVTVNGKSNFGNSTVFNVMPNKPSSVKVTGVTTKKATVSWKKISTATGYSLYRSTSPNGSFKYIGYVKNSKPQVFNEKSLGKGTFYYYKLRAYKTVSGKKYYSDWSSTVKINTKIYDTDFSLKRNAKKDTVTVNIKKVSGVTGYLVYMPDKNGKYKKAGSTTSLSFTKTGCLPGKTYSFKIRTYKDTPYGRIYGKLTAAKSTTMSKLPVTDFSLKRNAAKDTVTVKITPQKNVTGYMVYQRQANGKYKKVYRGVDSSFKAENCLPGKTYSFKVRTYKDTVGGRVYGAYSEIESVTMKGVPSTDFTFSKNRRAKTVTVKITPKKNVTGYYVYLQNSKGKLKKVYKGTEPQFVLKKCKKGKSYTFVIRTYKKTAAGTTAYGSKSEPKRIKF